jgi:hypothetical protein
MVIAEMESATIQAVVTIGNHRRVQRRSNDNVMYVGPPACCRLHDWIRLIVRRAAQGPAFCSRAVAVFYVTRISSTRDVGRADRDRRRSHSALSGRT